MHRNSNKLQSFECEHELVEANTPAASRPGQRPRSLDMATPYHSPSLQLFECEMVDLPDGTPAAPRPQDKARQISYDELQGREDVEQKVLSILLDPQPAPGKKAPSEMEYFREYLTEGWKVKQLTTVSTGGSCGWIIVLLEREPSKVLQ